MKSKGKGAGKDPKGSIGPKAKGKGTSSDQKGGKDRGKYRKAEALAKAEKARTTESRGI